MNGQLRSYLPENILLDGKHQQHTRMCHEELAVIDPANGYRVIAYRGSIPLKEQNMQKLFGISAKETDFLECTLTRHNRVLLKTADGGALLLYAELLAASGVLIAIKPHLCDTEVLEVLQKNEHHKFVLSPTFPNIAKNPKNNPHATAILDEIFYYMDHIMKKSDTIGVWTKSTLIANFAGCMLKRVSLPVDVLPTTEADSNRLIAFLFCIFLIARRRSASPAVITEVPFSDVTVFRYRLEFDPIASHFDDDEELPPLPQVLSQVHGFRDFRIREENKKLILEADLLYQSNQAPVSFHAFRASRFRIRIILE